ncbi:AraC family transcriptional regulator [Gorillibacterium massiliense]|uniref:AraC family transcriptional regulator n=1 Tax=Gorillibacterium massiliense TaxID=1280390 RepID=UPI0004B83A3D|nr:AraC family transcriptional regulator [Gorillibacterium massiliense]
MNLFRMPRLAQLNVKWTGNHQGNSPLADYEHSNPYFELMMVTEGPVYLKTDSDTLELASGDCFLLLPWERHTAWKRSHEQSGFFWVQFSVTPELIPASLKDLAAVASDQRLETSKQELRIAGDESEFLVLPRHYHPVRRYELLNLFENLHQESGRPHGYFHFRCTLLLGQILHLLAEDLLNREYGSLSAPAAYGTYRQLVNYLNESYSNPISRKSLEDLLNRKYEYLCQIFKKYAGMSILSYVHRLRIQRAQYLLRSSGQEIKEIAESVGFEDSYYFSRLFKRIVGASPTDYRKQAASGGVR